MSTVRERLKDLETAEVDQTDWNVEKDREIADLSLRFQKLEDADPWRGIDEKCREYMDARRKQPEPMPRRDHRLSHDEMLRAWNIVDRCFNELEKLRRP